MEPNILPHQQSLRHKPKKDRDQPTQDRDQPTKEETNLHQEETILQSKRPTSADEDMDQPLHTIPMRREATS